jgi:hypothetical protein
MTGDRLRSVEMVLEALPAELHQILAADLPELVDAIGSPGAAAARWSDPVDHGAD